MFARLLLVLALTLPTAHGAELLRFSPQGKTAVVTQVSARFSEPMAALGEQDAAAPFEIDCRHPGRAQWLGPATWTYEFERALPPGARCTFRLKPGLRALSGSAVAPRPAYVIETAGLGAQLLNGEFDLAEDDQVFAVGFNAPVEPLAAIRAMRCRVGEQLVPMHAVEPAQAKDLDWQIESFVAQWTREHGSAIPAPVVLGRCDTALPAGRSGELTIAADLAGVDGVRMQRAQRFAFKTVPPFGFEVMCTRRLPGQCSPREEIALHWTAPVREQDRQAVRLLLPDGRALAAQDDRYNPNRSTFAGPFPQLARLRIALPADMRDARGRPLVLGGQTLDIDTHAQVTDWMTPAGVAVLAPDAPQVPLAVPHHLHQQRWRARVLKLDTSSDQAVRAWLERVQQAAGPQPPRRALIPSGGAARSIALAPASSDPAHRSALPLPGKGLYVAEWAGGPAGPAGPVGKAPAWIRTAALVTDLALHVRQTREATLAWVTSISTGKPVAGARVSVQRPGAAAWSGVTGKDGLARIPFGSEDEQLFVVARTAADLAFAPVNPPPRLALAPGRERWRRDPHVATTVFDSTLIGPGGTVHMKHLRRLGSAAGLSIGADAPVRVVLAHAGSGRKYEHTLHWRRGQAVQDWTAPADAPLGEYRVRVGAHSTGSFRIEAAGPARSSATVEAPERFTLPQRPVATLSVTDLNGGPGHGSAGMRTRVQRGAGLTFPAHPHLVFANGADDADSMSNLGEQLQASLKGRAEPVRALLDQAGQARFTLPALGPQSYMRELLAEFDFADANGEMRSVQRKIEVAPAPELVAVDLAPAADPQRAAGATVVDLAGKPLAGRTVQLSWRMEEQGEPQAEQPLCRAVSDADGKVRCPLAVDPERRIRVIARLRTADGLQAAAHSFVVPVRYRAAGDARGLELLAPSGAQVPGTTVKLGVANSFAGGAMLVTAEREGFLHAQVVELDGLVDHVALPLRAEHAPNVTVNIVQTMGRAAAKGEGFWASASAPLNVAPEAQRLRVAVTADRPSYRPGEEARVAVAVSPAPGSALPPAAEVAVAVVDAGLLELKPNPSWDVLGALMQTRYPRVRAVGNMQLAETNAALQAIIYADDVSLSPPPPMAAPAPFIAPQQQAQAGPPRADFQPQVLWRATVPLDANGRAELPVRLSDALTRFRIVAVAQAGADRFGHGSTEVATRQDLEIKPLLPAVARAGDRLKARVVLRNRAQQEVDALASVTLRYPDGGGVTLPHSRVLLKAGEQRELDWPVQLPAHLRGAVAWTIAATAGAQQDSVRIDQTILPPERPRTLQAALLQLDRPQTLALQLPPGAEGAELTVKLAATLDGGLAGVQRYFDSYPYSCLEQRVSRSIALNDRAGWAGIMRDLERHVDVSRQLLRYFPADTQAGSDSLTVQLLQLARAAGVALPEHAEARLLVGLQGWLEGRHDGATRDLGLRRLAVLALLATRRTASAEQVAGIELLLDAWPTASVIDWMILLRHSAHPQRERLLAEASDQLRARLYTQGTALALSGEAQELRPWMMGHADVSMARLLLAVRDLPAWRADLPALARGLMQRQRDGHWHTTLANAWGALAMRSFAAAAPAGSVAGSTQLALNGDERRAAWPAAGKEAQRFALPASGELALRHGGAGAPWATVQAVATLPLAGERFNGIRIAKQITPVEQQTPGRWSRGDVARVRIELEARADMNWVVVDDPLPAGATVLGSGLGGDSALLAASPRTDGPATAYQERARDALRSYYPSVARGKWTLEYTLRLNSDGEFRLPATHAEAMYQPEVSGDLPNAAWLVGAPL